MGSGGGGTFVSLGGLVEVEVLLDVDVDVDVGLVRVVCFLVDLDFVLLTMVKG